MLALLVLYQVCTKLCEGWEDHGNDQHRFTDLLVDLGQFYGNTERQNIKESSAIDDREFGLKFDLATNSKQFEDYEHLRIDSNNQGSELGKYFRKKKLPDMEIRTEVERMIKGNSDDDNGNLILEKWDDPYIVKNLELRRIMKKDKKKINIPIQIQYEQFLPTLLNETQKSNDILAKAQVRKSLYKWYQGIKESGRFQL